jgi:hypothetical protein
VLLVFFVSCLLAIFDRSQFIGALEGRVSMRVLLSVYLSLLRITSNARILLIPQWFSGRVSQCKIVNSTSDKIQTKILFHIIHFAML